MKVTTGGREQIGNATLLVPEGEDAWIEFKAGSWNVRLNIVFEEVAGEAEGFKLTNKGDHGVVTFNRWSNAFPMAVEKPIAIGKTNDREILFLVSGYAVKGFKVLSFAFFWGAE